MKAVWRVAGHEGKIGHTRQKCNGAKDLRFVGLSGLERGQPARFQSKGSR